jgi:predicted anti-sigma-YlaC factor YlaD
MMRDQDAYKDLTDLFRAEDNALAPEPFTGDVMRRVRRTRQLRRVVVGGLGLAGAIVAASQLPALLAGWTGVDTSLTHALSAAPAELTELAASNPLWTAIAAAALLSALAAAAFERA